MLGAAPERGPRQVKPPSRAPDRGQVAGTSGSRGLGRPRRPPSPPLPLRSRPDAPPLPLATCGVGRIRPFVPRPSPAAPRGVPGANTAERRGSRAAPAPQISGPRGGGLAGQLRDCGRAGPAPLGAARAPSHPTAAPLSCKWPAGGRAPQLLQLTWGREDGAGWGGEDGEAVLASRSGPGPQQRPALSSRPEPRSP